LIFQNVINIRYRAYTSDSYLLVETEDDVVDLIMFKWFIGYLVGRHVLVVPMLRPIKHGVEIDLELIFAKDENSTHYLIYRLFKSAL
jgi:hypothetical protein